MLAGFLKLMIMCFPFSTMAISIYLQGRADLGPWAVLKMLPVAVGLLYAGKTIVDRGLHTRRWFGRAVVVAGVAALVLSRWAFARPRPSPLDPMFQAYRQQQAAAMATLRQQAADEAMRRQKAGGRMLATPDEGVKQELQSKTRRFT